MVKVVQKIDGIIQENIDIKGDEKKVLHFLANRTPIPSFALYQLKYDGFTRYQAGPHLIEIDIEPIAPETIDNEIVEGE